MREPPPEVDERELVAGVRRLWDGSVDRVAHQAVGFGAHHWAAYAGSTARLFVTYDRPVGAQGAADLEAAYAGAVALRDAGVEFVLAPLPVGSGRLTVPFAEGTLSATPWRDGTSEGPLDVAWTTRALRRLHAVAPPPGLPVWSPKVGPDFAETTSRLTERPWGPGPYADTARRAVRARLREIAGWTDRYHRLGDVARARPWTACHGEPHASNQLQTPGGRLLVDWDTLRLAPAELDLRTLVDAGVPAGEISADPELLELFDLQWRLDEISQYAAWFSGPHEGTRDDEIAIGGLLEELARE